MRLYVKMVVHESRHVLLPNMLVIPETFQICIASHIQMFFKLFCVETYMETSTPVFCLLTLEHSRWALKYRLFFRYADAILVSTLTDSSSCKKWRTFKCVVQIKITFPSKPTAKGKIASSKVTNENTCIT